MDAVDTLSDAIDATRNLLLPVDVWLWLKLSIVVLFVVGSGAGPTVPGGDIGTVAEDPAVEEEFDTDALLEELPEDAVLFVAVAVGIVLLVWLLFGLIGALMEFVFIESLRSAEVHVRQYAGRNVGRGVRLFGFRVLLSVLVTAIAAGPLVYRYLTTDSLAAVASWAVWIGLLSLPIYLVYAIVMRFTSEFVAPIMLLEDRGVIGGWQRFWGTLTANWKEYVVYLLLAWIILAVIQLSITFVFAIGGILIAIPFTILAVFALALGEIGVVLAAPIAIVGFLLFVLFYAVVWMPIRSYFQYYALLLLGDTNPDLDLIPDQRRAIRSAPGTPTGQPQRDEPDHPDGRWGSDEEPDSSRLWDDESDSRDERDDADRGW